ncbi:MAG: hypothetical protein ACOCVF_03490 [bacterium]
MYSKKTIILTDIDLKKESKNKSVEDLSYTDFNFKKKETINKADLIIYADYMNNVIKIIKNKYTLKEFINFIF